MADGSRYTSADRFNTKALGHVDDALTSPLPPQLPLFMYPASGALLDPEDNASNDARERKVDRDCGNCTKQVVEPEMRGAIIAKKRCDN